MNVSELFVKCLEKEGVEYIFGLAGEENLHFMQALSSSSIRYITVRHEQAAGFMAASYGRLTGKPGVCLSTLGPGATNLVTAAAYAKLGAMPMIMLTGQKPIKVAPQGDFQILNIVDMMKPLTKYSKQIVYGDNVPYEVRKAFRIAEYERPGPVHLELPKDIAIDPVEGAPLEIEKSRRPIAEDKAIRWAVEMIESAKRPLILIGAGANRKRTSKMLGELIGKTGIPFFNTQMGTGVVDERHPLFLGTAALSSKDYLHCAIEHADLIVNVGHDIIEKPPFTMRKDSAKIIHINFYPATVGRVYFPQLEVIGDIANAVWQINEAISRQDSWDFSYFIKYKKVVDSKTSENSDSDKVPMLPQRIVSDVRKAVPEDGIVTLDNGMYKLWFTRNYKVYGQNTLLVDNALATMGAGLPSAIAAKLLNPNKHVMAVAGDGGFMMNSQELETAVRLKLDLVVLLIRDDSFGMIKWEQKEKNYADFGLDFGNPDFVKLAESYGAKGHRIKNALDFLPTLKNALNGKGVHLIDCPVDYSANYEVFTKEISNIVCEIESMD